MLSQLWHPITRIWPWIQQRHWMDWIGYGTLAVITVLIGFGYTPGDPRRWWAIALMLAVIALFLTNSLETPYIARHPLRYGLLTLLVIGLFAVEANLTVLIVIFFVLSGEIMLLLPVRTGLIWIGLWGMLTCVLVMIASGDWLLSLLTGIGAGSGYFFVGSAANAQLRAETANAESQRLLAELQVAHRQLQTYAARAEEFAIAQERNRLAREVHDTLGHRLTVAAVQLEGAQRLIPLAPEKAVAMLETVREQVREGLTELRRTVSALRTPLEAELSLPSALLTLVQQFETATGLTIQLDLPTHLPNLTPEQQQACYRTAQEALTNVQRHAAAQHVHLQLLDDQAAAVVQLVISDDGQGLSSVAVAQGFGLRGLRERAEHLNGEFLIRTGDLGGVEILLRLPYHNAEEQTTS